MKNITVKRLSLDAIMLACLIVSAYIIIPLPTIAITLQVLVVFLIILLSKSYDGILILTVYAIMGTIGLPVFNGVNGIASPTYGFILGFIISSIVIFVIDKLLLKKEENNNISLIVKSCIFIVTIYLIGLPYAMFILDNEFIAMLLFFLPYILSDIVKIFIAVIIYKRLKNIIEY